MVVDAIPDLPSLVYVLIYDTKPDYFHSMCFKSIRWVHKTCQVYDPKSDIVPDDHFFRMNVNILYNHNMKSVNPSDQIRNV